MRRFAPALAALFCFILCACGNGAASPASEAAAADSMKHYAVNPQEIAKDWMTWYTYAYHELRLAKDFIGQDEDSSRLGKPLFLQKLATGQFLAFKVASIRNTPVYRLVRPETVNQEISHTIAEMARTAQALMEREGRPLPPYRFTDLAGNTYDTATTRGKLLVVKCWFINCVACVKEFPELNGLVAKYTDRQDVLFLSLASDSKKALEAFLAKKSFRYAVVPEAKDYMNEELALTGYPTHFLVDRTGIVRKATNSIEDLLPSLEKELE
jgi:thiol-disulfide isomerase/thioredoxin